MFELLKRLAKKNHVHLFSFVESKQELEQKKTLEKHFQGVTLILKKRNREGRLTYPNTVSEFTQPDYTMALETLLEVEKFDIIQAEYPFLSQYQLLAPDVKKVITEIDILFHTQMQKAYSQKSIFKKITDLHEAFRLFAYEKKFGRDADLVLAMSPKEGKYFHEMTGARVKVSPNGVDTKAIEYRLPGKAHQILFVGNFRHSPNLDAILYFVKEIYPLIRKRDLSARLVIAGANPPDKVKRTAMDPSVTVTGFVPDIIPFYYSSGCVVAPITRGSGTRLKILEAMAAGVPVVSTSIGIEGIEASDQRDILIADKPDKFADSVLRIFADRDLANNISKNGRMLMEEKYDWDTISRKLIDDYRELLRDQ